MLVPRRHSVNIWKNYWPKRKRWLKSGCTHLHRKEIRGIDWWGHFCLPSLHSSLLVLGGRQTEAADRKQQQRRAKSHCHLDTWGGWEKPLSDASTLSECSPAKANSPRQHQKKGSKGWEQRLPPLPSDSQRFKQEAPCDYRFRPSDIILTRGLLTSGEFKSQRHQAGYL